MLVANARSWCPIYKPKPSAVLRLVCFPPAGAAARAYQKWELPDTMDLVALELPGHGARRREPLASVWPDLVRSVTDDLSTLEEQPCAFFGFSFGAKLAYEVARELVRRGKSEPVHLFAAASAAPRVSRSRGRGTLDDQALVAELEKMGGTSPALFSSPAILGFYLPIVRADFMLDDGYTRADGPGLTCPVTVFGGTRDADSPLDALEAWREETSGPFGLETLDEGHFFLDSRREWLTDYVVKALVK